MSPTTARAQHDAGVAHAQGIVTGAHAAARLRATQTTRADEAEAFARHVRFQAALEAQVGLRLFATGDDYRAITALRRHALLDPTPQARHLSALIIGHIYHRNARHQLAAESFEEAMLSAPDVPTRAWSYLLEIQQLCVPLRLIGDCRARLAALSDVRALTDRQRELVAYQTLFADVLLRDPSVQQRARLDALRDPLLVKHAQALQRLDRGFDALPLQRPWLAATLSALLPGAGQAYNGRWGDAVSALLINGALGAATYYSFVELESVPAGVVSAALLAGFYAGNIVNAYTDAERINAQHYKGFFEGMTQQHWPRVRFDITRDTVRFGYRFDWPGPPRPDAAPPSTPAGARRSVESPGDTL